ncbi:MAG TPA: hypothetical protein VIK95_12525 [Egibacteraceae bacterium]
MDLTALHGYVIGFAIMASWLVIMVWALVLRLLRAEDTPVFWRAVSVAQILLVVQLVVGITLFLMGRVPGPAGGVGTVVFHLAYGVVFPLVVLVVGHGMARAGRYRPHTVFAVVGLVNFALALRAWMVGISGF